MKTIVVSLLKGGVGKTFLATHLAWYLAEPPERRVAFVDLDPQGSSTRRLGAERQGGFSADLFDPAAAMCADGQAGRSEERRVGQECVRKCRSRWSQYH